MENVKWEQIKKDGHLYCVTSLGETKSSDIVSKILQKHKFGLLPIQVGCGVPKNLGIKCDFFICGNDNQDSREKIEKIRLEVEQLLNEKEVLLWLQKESSICAPIVGKSKLN